MNNQSETELLRMLADRAGIASDYYDIAGTLHVTTDETRRAILRAMGFRTDSRDELIEELTNWEQRSWLRICEPVYVVRGEGIAGSWSVSIPCEPGGEVSVVVQWSLRGEDGTVSYERIEGPGLVVHEERLIAERRYIRSIFAFPCGLPLGYYHGAVHVQGGAVQSEATFLLIVAPSRCYVPDCFLQGRRLWGLSLQLYSLRSERNWGVGDFRDLANMMEWAGIKLGAAVIGLNPLHALRNSMPYHISPYSPNSRLFLNELYVDMNSVPELAEPVVQQRLTDPLFRSWLDELRRKELIDYDGVARAKRTVLEWCYEAFLKNNFVGDEPDLQPATERGVKFETYVKQEGATLWWYAVFQALDEEQRSIGVMQWAEWPLEFRSPFSSAVREYEHRHRRRVRFFLYMQWLAALQLEALVSKSKEAGMAVGFYHDVALGSDRNGADGWRFQDLLVLNANCGAPPDAFAPDGQNWGFPPINPHHLYESGYALFIEVLRRNLRYGGALRIDHVMALFRLFWIPQGLPASAGTYVQYPWEDLLAILALESVRAGTVVIGEDLGTVPDWIRERLEQAGVLSYRVFFFERTVTGDWKSPGAYPSQALAVVATHDLPTLVGYWDAADIELRAQLSGVADHVKQKWLDERHYNKTRMVAALQSEGLLPAQMPDNLSLSPTFMGELIEAVHCYLARTPAWLMLVAVEDVLGVRDQVNLPGTVDDHPNWRRKLPLTVEEMLRDPRFERLAGQLRLIRGSTLAS